MDSNLTGGRTGAELYDLGSDENLALFNPRMSSAEIEALAARLSLVDHLSGHIFVLSSGTTTSQRVPKWVALAKEAVLASARASVAILQETRDDVWLHLLPSFHVGGMGIWARSAVSGSKVVVGNMPKWSAPAGFDAIVASRATLVSLVPTQVHDLVQLDPSVPAHLRAILVGGGRIDPHLFAAARNLGWPLLRTYGMTETASQAATESLSSLSAPPMDEPVFEILPHLSARSGFDDRLALMGSSLLSGWIVEDSSGQPVYEDPKDEKGWLVTQDLGRVTGRTLTVTGRASHIVKVLGETVSLAKLEAILTEVAGKMAPHVALVDVPDARLEARIVLAFEPPLTQDLAESIQGRFLTKVLPFERIRACVMVPEIPRTELGKVKTGDLRPLCQPFSKNQDV